MIGGPNTSLPLRPRKIRRRRLPIIHGLILLVLTVGVTSLAIFGLAWWQDRPLRVMAQLLADKEYQSTLKLADQFLAEHARDSRAQILKARALSLLGHHAASDVVFQQAAMQLNGFPDDSAALRDWSTSLLEMQQWSRAISILETLVKSFPEDPALLYPLTVARVRMLQYDAAMESAKALAAIPGEEQQAKVIIGTIYHDQGNGRAALGAWEEILAENPDAKDLQIMPGELFAMVGEQLLDLGIPVRSALMFEQSLKTLPASRTYSLLGRAYLQLNREADAVEAWEKALAIDPLELIAAEELANVALRNGDAQRAVDLIMPLTASADLHSSSAYILQRALTRLGQSEKAEAWRVRANSLRETEENRSTLTELIRNSHDPFWSGFLRAYQLADRQQWNNAESIVVSLLKQRADEPLLVQLAEAIRQRGKLPSLSELTNKNY